MRNSLMGKRPSKDRGCWTCFLRRKGCDRQQPICMACSRLGVTCHGYGERPDWMDDREKQDNMKQELRLVVKATTDRGRPDRARRSRRGQKEATDSAFTPTRNLRPPSSPKVADEHCLDNTAVQPCSTTTSGYPPRYDIQDASHKIHQLPNHSPRLSQTQMTTRTSENHLVFLYLDRVFPRLFPYYCAYRAEDGREWMFSLMIQSKPLLSAALGLAALYQESLLVSTGEESQVPLYKRRREKLYVSALKELQGRISQLSHKSGMQGLKDGIEVLACIVHLIIMEVSCGQSENWQKHLLAAPSLHPFLRTYCSPISRRIVATSSDDFSMKGHEAGSRITSSLSSADHVGMGFFSAVILWFDILACASTGQGPRYPDICAAALGPQSTIQLQYLMGCENWVMVLIREIATLEHWKKHMLSASMLEAAELGLKADLLKQRLQSGIEKLSRELNCEQTTSTLPNLKQTSRIFASAAYVYLHVVDVGPDPDNPDIKWGVHEVTSGFENIPSSMSLQGLAWPFCIAGCMACPDQMENFRDIATRNEMGGWEWGSLRGSLDIMEKCWQSRDNLGQYHYWFGAMEELGRHTLLV